MNGKRSQNIRGCHSRPSSECVEPVLAFEDSFWSYGFLRCDLLADRGFDSDSRSVVLRRGFHQVRGAEQLDNKRVLSFGRGRCPSFKQHSMDSYRSCGGSWIVSVLHGVEQRVQLLQRAERGGEQPVLHSSRACSGDSSELLLDSGDTRVLRGVLGLRAHRQPVTCLDSGDCTYNGKCCDSGELACALVLDCEFVRGRGLRVHVCSRSVRWGRGYEPVGVLLRVQRPDVKSAWWGVRELDSSRVAQRSGHRYEDAFYSAFGGFPMSGVAA